MTDNDRIKSPASSDRARARVRRVTGGIVIASLALAGTIAGYVGQAATHKKSTGAAASTEDPVRVAVPSAPAAPTLPAPGESALQQPQSIAPPSQAPSATQQPPAAVSGAS